jgi:hypothetical protein
MGVQVVRADLNDEASVKTAVEGAHFVFLVTDFWSAPDPHAATEKAQAKSAINLIAKLPNLEHLIWSSLPSIKKASGGKYSNVIHFEGKSEIDGWIERTYPELWKKTTILWVGCYMQLWIQFQPVFAPQKRVINEKEVWVQESSFNPSVKLPLADVNETGKVILAILDKREVLSGKTVSFVGDSSLTIQQQLETWGKLFKKDVEIKTISDEENSKKIESLGYPEFLVKDLSDTVGAYSNLEGRINHAEGVIMASDIVPERERLRSWEEYIKSENWEKFLQE